MARRARVPLAGDLGPAIVTIKDASGLTWEELARLLGTNAVNLWRWRNGVRPDTDHLLALQALARSLGLEHTLPVASLDFPPEPWAGFCS